MIFLWKNKKVYYERHGSGSPLILLNGIMMSTISWNPFIETLSKHHELLLIDFLDQGQSDSMKEPYTIETQAQMLSDFIDEKIKGIPNIVGISYGVEVALTLASNQSTKINKLILFNGSYRTSRWLEDIGRGWKEIQENPKGYYLATIPWIYSPRFYIENEKKMSDREQLLIGSVFNQEHFMQRMHRLTTSSEGYNVHDKLTNIQTKTLVVSGLQDYLVPKEEQDELVRRLPNATAIYLPNTGHASMYEQPELFCTLILGFVAVEGAIKVL